MGITTTGELMIEIDTTTYLFNIAFVDLYLLMFGKMRMIAYELEQ